MPPKPKAAGKSKTVQAAKANAKAAKTMKSKSKALKPTKV